MLVAVWAWFPVARLVAILWIPAPAFARVTFFRGNDGVDSGDGDLSVSLGLYQHPGRAGGVFALG